MKNKTTGGRESDDRFLRTTSAHERNKANPDGKDLSDPKEVWKDGEKTPTGIRRSPAGQSKRVADAGDIGGGTPLPYDSEVQAESVGDQTGPNRNKPQSRNVR